MRSRPPSLRVDPQLETRTDTSAADTHGHLGGLGHDGRRVLGVFDLWILSPETEQMTQAAGADTAQDASVALLLSGVAAAGIAGLVRLKVGGSPRGEQGERELDLRNREVLALVGLAWFVACFFAALPFVIWPRLAGIDEHVLLHPVNCLFESMSGLTTTGATIIPDLDTVPRPLLLWRR